MIIPLSTTNCTKKSSVKLTPRCPSRSRLQKRPFQWIPRSGLKFPGCGGTVLLSFMTMRWNASTRKETIYCNSWSRAAQRIIWRIFTAPPARQSPRNLRQIGWSLRSRSMRKHWPFWTGQFGIVAILTSYTTVIWITMKRRTPWTLKCPIL